MDSNFFRKTNDVYCVPDLLRLLKADHLLHIRGVDVLNYLSCDIALLERRSKIFYDTDHIAGLSELLDRLITDLSYVADMVKMQSTADESERGLYSVKQLEQYFGVIDRADAFYTKNHAAFTSEDYVSLFGNIHTLASSDEYIRLKKGTAELLKKISGIRSISVGFNFDPSLAPYEAGILSLNDRYIESGALIDRILRLDTDTAHTSLAPLVAPKKQCKKNEYEVLNMSLYSALNKVFRRLIKQWEPEVNAYIAEKLSFLLDVLPDLRFIAEMRKIQQKMSGCGLKLCRPEYRPKEERVFTARELYNPILAMLLAERGKGTVVKNNLSFDKDGTVYLLTGPNNGGKSEFLTAVCLTQVMAQLGILVPADSLVISPADTIALDIPKYSALNEKGRLAEECSVIAEIFRHLTAYSLALFDEAFSSTSASEAVELSENVLRALSYKGTRSIYSTHFHQLTGCAEEINSSAGERGKVDFLVAGIDGEQNRTYRIHRAAPDGNSYAKSIAEQYGIRFDLLIKEGES